MLIADFRGERINDEIISLLSYVKPGEWFFDYDLPSKEEKERNISSPSQLSKLIRSLRSLSKTGLFIAAVDAEGGFANRLEPEYGFQISDPSHKEPGTENISETYAAAEKIARELKSVGVNFNFATVADVDINPESPVIGQMGSSFGDDPQDMVLRASVFVTAHDNHSVITALKHFPGHGSAAGDTHI